MTPTPPTHSTLNRRLRTAVNIRLMGLPDDVDQVVAQLTEVLDVADISRPYPCRGGSRQVRVYLTVHSHNDADVPADGEGRNRR